MKVSQAKIRTPSSNLDRKIISKGSGKVTNVTNSDKKGEYYYLGVNQLIPFHNQARIYFDDEKILELSKTIKKHGMRQPLTVLKSNIENGKYEIVSGERRYRAAKIIGLNNLPCIIIIDQENAEEIALIENIQRENLHPIELGKAYLKLYNSKSINTHIQIAEKLNVSRSQVTELLSFAEINKNQAETLIKNNISERRILRKIISLKDETERENYIFSLIKNKDQKKDFVTSFKENRKISRKSNIVSFILEGDSIEMKHKPLNKLKEAELKVLKEKLLKLLDEVSKYD